MMRIVLKYVSFARVFGVMNRVFSSIGGSSSGRTADSDSVNLQEISMT